MNDRIEVHRRPRRAVIGIDQSYTGFAACVYYRDDAHHVHRRNFDVAKSHGINRLCDIGAWLTEIISNCPAQIEHVCMEDYARGRRNGREESGELAAVVKLTLRTHPLLRDPACYPTVVSVSALKKFVTGTGRGEKSDMKLHCFKKWGQEFRDSDSADSYGLARIAAAIQWGDGALHGYQLDVLKNLRHHTER